MASLRKLTTGALAAAILITSASPAFARRGYGYGHGGYGYGYGGYGRGWHGRHHNHVDAGDVIAGVAIVGILAAVLSSASRSKNQTTTAPTGYPQQSNSQQNGDISSEEAAVDACAMATEAQAGQRASVRDISQVDRNADGWDVEGLVEQRTDWRNNSDTDRRRFTCKVRYGAVADVYIASDVASLN